MPMICRVILDQPSRHIDRLFDYWTRESFSPGQAVQVPFGRGSRELQAVIFAIRTPEPGQEEKDFKSLKGDPNALPVVKPEDLTLIEWLRKEYLCTYSEALALFYPRSQRKRKLPLVSTWRLQDRMALQERQVALRKNSLRRQKLYDHLLEKGFTDLNALCAIGLKDVKPLLQELVETGVLLEEKKLFFKPLSGLPALKSHFTRHTLSQLQESAVRRIQREFSEHNRPVLLRGVTGSGKTEIYMELIETVLKRGHSVLVLVPEISLTPQTIERFSQRFGEAVCVLHSHLSASVRAGQWQKIQAMPQSLVIGARSALFAPVHKRALVIIDECHDDAYRSEQNPKYSAVQVAVKMNEISATCVLLGSATPTVEQYYQALKGLFHLEELEVRANLLPLPEVEVIDMKEEVRDGHLHFLSRSLIGAIDETTKRGAQALLFLNRRGYSSFLLCKDCGYVPECPNCDISLTYHRYPSHLRCHYCASTFASIALCPVCGSEAVREMGVGTQKIESELREMFPDLPLFRMDRDSVLEEGGHQGILERFRQTAPAVLIGTQMIGKGLDFPKVEIAGILNADQGLRMPDFRSHEKAFSLLEQVGGRAGRGRSAGRVLIQTYDPVNYTLRFLIDHDYRGFYQEEIALRKHFHYPPFGNLIRVLISSEDEKKAASGARKIKEGLIHYLKRKEYDGKDLYGPSPCLVGRIEKRYRYQLLFRDLHIPAELVMEILRYLLSEKRRLVVPEQVAVSVEKNPTAMF